MPDAMDAAWNALRSRLQVRSRELYEEVRIYPRPIARCDEQLTKAIEERDAAFRHVRRANDLDALRNALQRDAWRTAVRAFVEKLELSGDPAMTTAREKVVAALRLR